MRVLEIIASVNPESGGPVEGLLRLDEASRGLGVEREVVSCDPANAPFLASFPIKVYALGECAQTATDRRLARYGYTSRLVPWLRSHAGDYDAIVVNGLWNYATHASAMILPHGKTPYFVFTHGMLDPWFRRRYPLKHLAKQAFWTVFEGPLLAGSRSVLFTTDEERALARSQFVGWRYPERVVGYGTAEPPPATPEQTTAFRASVAALGNRPYLLFLSRIHPKKGCDLLIEAFARIAAEQPHLDLVFAGPDQTGWTAKLKAQAAGQGVAGRIHWPGPLYGDAKWGAMRGAEAFALPSHQENFGVVVAEALACGAPVLLTDKVNIWREVERGGGGLVGPDDVNGVEQVLRRFLALTPNDRARMRDSAQATFTANFEVNAIARNLHEVLRA